MMIRNCISLGLALMFAATVLSSCSSDDMDELVQKQQEEKVISLISSVRTTRGTSEQQTTALAEGIHVGAFGLSEGNTITNGDNNEYAAGSDGALTTTSEDMKCPGSATIYAYAPFQSGWGLTADNSFSVSTDQSGDGYLASDLLWATASTSETTASLTFAHKLARVCITVTNNTGADLTNVSVSILNTKIQTSLNPSTGSVGEANGETTPVTLATGQAIAAGASLTVYGIIVPQSISTGIELIDINDGTKDIKWNTTDDISFVGGQSSNFSVTIP